MDYLTVDCQNTEQSSAILTRINEWRSKTYCIDYCIRNGDRMRTFTMLFALTVMPCCLFGQLKGGLITNVDFVNMNDSLRITYDISGSMLQEDYYVTCVAIDKGRQRFHLKSVSGDIRNVKGGGQKEIIWKWRDDFPYAKELEIAFEVSAVRLLPNDIGQNMWYSTKYPGYGTYELTGEKLNLLWGALGYTSLAASIVYEYSAEKNYSDYRKKLKEKYYSKAVAQRKQSYIFAAGALATWLINYAILAKKSYDVKNGGITVRNRGTFTSKVSQSKSIYSKVRSESK